MRLGHGRRRNVRDTEAHNYRMLPPHPALRRALRELPRGRGALGRKRSTGGATIVRSGQFSDGAGMREHMSRATTVAHRNAASAAPLDRAVSAARNPSAGIGRANSQPCP